LIAIDRADAGALLALRHLRVSGRVLIDRVGCAENRRARFGRSISAAHPIERLPQVRPAR
jgi:hypothetical protein